MSHDLPWRTRFISQELHDSLLFLLVKNYLRSTVLLKPLTASWSITSSGIERYYKGSPVRSLSKTTMLLFFVLFLLINTRCKYFTDFFLFNFFPASVYATPTTLSLSSNTYSYRHTCNARSLSPPVWPSGSSSFNSSVKMSVWLN